MKLLIVDDEVFAIEGIKAGVNWDVLEFSEVLTANSYAQAVEIMEKNPAEIILCDIEMPNESGLELVAWVNEHHPMTECIILSCHDEFDFARQAVKLKCLDYILKPTRYDFLTEVLHKAIQTVKEKNHQNIMEGYGQLYIENLSKSSGAQTENIAEKTAHYIEQHLSEELSVGSLANMVYVSSDHLTRTFKKQYQCTVSDYILKKRMIMAGELIRQPGMTVTMLSDAVGFGNYSYFTEQFKKYYGMTPREYQHKYQNKTV
jgi:two-component system, response regulator YesN